MISETFAISRLQPTSAVVVMFLFSFFFFLWAGVSIKANLITLKRRQIWPSMDNVSYWCELTVKRK